MSLAFADRVQDTSTTTGTGDVTLDASPPTGRVAFGSVFDTSVRFGYMIQTTSGAEWEVGIGYLSAATTLVREEVKASSNSGSLTNFSAGSKTVACVLPASFAQELSDYGVALMVQRGLFL